MIEQFLTTEQVANILQVHPFTILKFIKEGKLKGIKLGRVYRIKESEVHEFLENRSTGKHATKSPVRLPDGPPDGHKASPQAKSSIEHLSREVESEKTPEPFKLEKDGEGEEGQHYYII